MTWRSKRRQPAEVPPFSVVYLGELAPGSWWECVKKTNEFGYELRAHPPTNINLIVTEARTGKQLFGLPDTPLEAIRTLLFGARHRLADTRLELLDLREDRELAGPLDATEIEEWLKAEDELLDELMAYRLEVEELTALRDYAITNNLEQTLWS